MESLQMMGTWQFLEENKSILVATCSGPWIGRPESVMKGVKWFGLEECVSTTDGGKWNPPSY